ALLSLCARRPNMIPILADARNPASYAPLVREADVIYQDVAQPDQVDIMLKNASMFLKKDGYILLALKARSIDVTKEPREIFRDEIERLDKEMEILDMKILDPFEKDHAMFVLQK
ncbi:MAG: fibrillarin-like rRNA/tRNA 2'-O-methyltransferase, partial [Candidatus Hadarchaeales archaeon]